jgi:cytoskeletal protein CcmA (bactofilin family)
MNFPKLKAHVLLSALVISIIVSIIISSVLLLHYNNNLQWIRYKNNDRLQRNLQSAVNIVIADTINFNTATEERFDLFGDIDDSVSIAKELWGAFNLAKVKSVYKTKTLRKNFFYGPVLNDTLGSCLYIVDHHRPIQISGSTKLIGDAFIPGGSIKTTSIDGKEFEGKVTVLGNIFKSDTSFPSANNYRIDELYKIFKKTYDKDFKRLNLKATEDSISNSFDNDALYYYISGNSNVVAQKRIQGKIILFSDSAITIKGNTKIEDAIIMAPEINIEDNFTGSVQLVANRIIKVGKHCKLNYPSSILLLKDSVNNYQGLIEIADSSSISGFIFANAAKKDFYKNTVELKKGSLFEGVICVHGYLQTKGVIYGTLITDYFLYKSIISTYENTLVDVVADRTKLSPYFIGSAVIKNPGKLKVIKWLR